MSKPQSTSALFGTGTFRAVELGADDIPRLQRFFEHNEEYFSSVNGQPPTSTEAFNEIEGALPEGWPYTKKWIIGFVDEADCLLGLANVVSDLLAPHIWHIGLLLVATRLHGQGVARSMFEQLENWARALGAQWLRLGVVEGNLRAERFWERCGFVEVRKRHGVEMGGLKNTIRVMAKSLTGQSLFEYLALVARDRSEAC